jgi:hypothetical protein
VSILPQNWRRGGLGKIATEQENFRVDTALTEDEILLLELLADAGAAGRTIAGLSSRARYLRLLHLKYVTEQSASLDTVVYCITDAGRVALAQATGEGSI